MTNVEALKEVYVALGGNAEDFTAETNDEAIALLATVAAGGGGGGGNSDFFFVTFTGDSPIVADKTFEEARAAGAGKKVIVGMYSGIVYIPTGSIFDDDEEIELSAQLSLYKVSNSQIQLNTRNLAWASDETITVTGQNFTLATS